MGKNESTILRMNGDAGQSSIVIKIQYGLVLPLSMMMITAEGATCCQTCDLFLIYTPYNVDNLCLITYLTAVLSLAYVSLYDCHSALQAAMM